MASEEERAAAYRRSLVVRESSTRTALRRLVGNPSARLTLRENWRPWWQPQPQTVEAEDSDRTNA